MMHPHPSSLPFDYHRLHHDELVEEARIRRLARRGRSRRPPRTKRDHWPPVRP